MCTSSIILPALFQSRRELAYIKASFVTVVFDLALAVGYVLLSVLLVLLGLFCFFFKVNDTD